MIYKNNNDSWHKSSWKNYNIQQNIIYNNKDLLIKIKNKIVEFPPLINYVEILSLKKKLSFALKNDAFILHIGECAESFDDFSGSYINDYIKLFASIEEMFGKKKLVKIGRFAGQFAKPRTFSVQKMGEVELPNYQGDIINGFNFDASSREANPLRLIEAYAQSAITSNVLESKFYISHEAFLLDYEECFIKQNPSDKKYYSSLAHYLWVGKRTNIANSAHIEFVRGIENPVALKVSPETDLEDLENNIKLIAPTEGKLILVGRYGVNNVEKNLLQLITILKKYPEIIYICDPMHGNTYCKDKFKVREINDIKSEISITHKVLVHSGLRLNGIMLEATNEMVAECIGGESSIESAGYKSKCDPRLNRQQTLEVVQYVRDLLCK